MLRMLVLLTATITMTTSAAALYCARRLHWPREALRAAAGDLLVGLGLFACFYALDVLAMVLLIRIARTATDAFLSYYLANDLSLPIMAALQGALFRLWWLRLAAKPSTAQPRPPRAAPDSQPPPR